MFVAIVYCRAFSNNGGGRIEEQSLAKAMDSLESVLKKVADAQVQYEIWVNP